VTPSTPSSALPVLPLTEARTQLFRLAEDVLSGQVDRVRLTHRSQPDDLLLMRASAVAQLERELADLRSRIAPELRPLSGLGTLLVSDEALLADIAAARASHASHGERTRGELAAGLHYPSARPRMAQVAETTTKSASKTRAAAATTTSRRKAAPRRPER